MAQTEVEIHEAREGCDLCRKTLESFHEIAKHFQRELSALAESDNYKTRYIEFLERCIQQHHQESAPPGYYVSHRPVKGDDVVARQ